MMMIPEDQLIPVTLQAQLIGRLRNVSAPKNWCMAVAEAVQNSMDSIEDSARRGHIEIELMRGGDLASGGGAIAPITHVLVRDNGSGFNDDNFQSFCTCMCLPVQLAPSFVD